MKHSPNKDLVLVHKTMRKNDDVNLSFFAASFLNFY